MDPATLIAALIGAFGSIFAATVGARARSAARATDHTLRNGITQELQGIKSQQVTHGARLERVETKVDRGHAQLADHIAEAEQRYREILEWRRNP